MQLTKEVAQELNNLAAKNPNIDVNSKEVQETIFCKEFAGQTELVTLFKKLTPNAFLLLARIITTSDTINTLSVAFNSLHDQLAIDFAKEIAFSKITTLEMGSNRVNGQVLVQFAKALEPSNITALDMKNNEITGQDAAQFIEALAPSNVTTLKMDNNEITGQGAVQFAKSFEHSNVTTLSICYNEITSQDAVQFAEALEPSNVTTLDMVGNKITGQDAGAFIKALINSGVAALITDEKIFSEEEYLSLVPLLHDIEISSSPESFKEACALYNATKIIEIGDVLVGEISDDPISIVQSYMGSSKFAKATAYLDLIFSQQPSLFAFLKLPASVQKYVASKITNLYKNDSNITEEACTKLVPLLHEIEIPDLPQFQKEAAHYNAAKIRETTQTIIGTIGNNPLSIVQKYMGSEKFAEAIASLDSIFSPQPSAKDFSTLSKHVKDYIVASLYDTFLEVCKAYLATTTESSSAKITENHATPSDAELTGDIAPSDID